MSQEHQGFHQDWVHLSKAPWPQSHSDPRQGRDMLAYFLCVPNSRMKQPKAQATVPSCKNQEEKESGYVTFLVSNGKG